MCAAGNDRARRAGPSSGMTLLELLVVLVIATLMLALVAPDIGRVLPGSELKGFARQSAALMRELRSEAISLSQWQALTLDQAARRYRAGDGAGLAWPEGIDVTLEQGPVAAFLRDPLADQQRLLFFPDGSSNGGTLRLGSAAGHYLIRVEALNGRVWIDE